MNYQDILDKYVGKPVEAEDPSNKFQCFDWAFKYCDEIGAPREAIRHFYAYQIFTNPNDLTLQYFEYIPNTLNGVPKLGDIIIFSTGVGPAGHVAVVQSANTNNIHSLDQNWSNHSYCEYVNHPYDDVLGWLRPKIQADSAIIAQSTAQPITDQTKIPQIDNMEVQAIHSTLMDLNRENDELKRQLKGCQDKTIYTLPTDSSNTTPTVVPVVTPPTNPSPSILTILSELFRGLWFGKKN